MTQQVETAHAPNVEPDWTSAFVKEAQLHDVPSSVIESTLNEVDVNVKDSGRSAQELYGNPVSYATELGESEMPAPLARLASSIGPLLMQVLGTLMIGFTVFRSEDAGNVPVTWGSMIAFALMALLYITLASRTLCTWVMRGLMARPIVSIVSVLVYLALIVYMATVPGIYFTIPQIVMLVLGAILVGIGLIWGVMRGSGQDSGTAANTSKGGVLLPYLILPVISAILLALQLVL